MIPYAVVIPSRDRPGLLAAAVASAQAQSVPPAEIVVVDDGSRVPVMATALPGGAPVRVVRNPRSLGGAASRNRGIRATACAVVAFLDDDDRWDPTKMERQLALLAARPDCAACVCARRVERDGRCFDEVFTPAFAWRYRHHENHYGSFTQLVARVRDRSGRLTLLDERMKSCQDWDFILALLTRGEVAVLPEALVTIAYHRGPRISNAAGRQRGYRRFRRKHRPRISTRAAAWLQARAWFAAAERCGQPFGRLLFSGLGVLAAAVSDFPPARRAVSAVRWSLEAWIGYEAVEDLRFRWRAGPGRRLARLLGVSCA